MSALLQFTSLLPIYMAATSASFIALALYIRNLTTERSRNQKTLSAAAERLITYQKQMLFLQKKIQDEGKNNILEKFFGESDIYACIINHAGGVISMNPFLEEAVGINRIDALLKPYHEVFSFMDQSGKPNYLAIEDGLKGLAGTLPRWTFLETRKGRIAIEGMISLYTDEGGIRNLALIFSDATKEYESDQTKNAELNTLKKDLSDTKKELTQISEADAYLLKFFSSTDSCLIFLDPLGHIVSLNPQAESFLSRRTDTVKGQLFQHAISLSDKTDTPSYGAIADALKGIPCPFKRWTFVTTKNGKSPISGSVIPLKDTTRVTGVAISFRDSTGEYQMEQEEKAFFSGAAHDLRAPLTTVRSVIEFLFDSYDTLPKKEAVEMLKSARESAVHLVSLVNDLLNVSRIEQGKVDIVKEAFDITSLTKEIVDAHRMVARERNLYINQEVAEFVPKVYGDKPKTIDVITNLVSNAIKYSHYGGVTVTHSSEGGRVFVNVTDTGIGISSQNKRLLFKKFQQVGTARHQSYTKSTGLGLYIAKKFAVLMGGDIELTASEVGKGSTFTFWLPVAPTSA